MTLTYLIYFGYFYFFLFNLIIIAKDKTQTNYSIQNKNPAKTLNMLQIKN